MLVRKDGAEARKERIAEIAKTIQSELYANNGDISLRRISARIQITTGLTHLKVMEYLQLLSEAGQFELNEKDEKITRVQV